jgi:hypothetical protein
MERSSSGAFDPETDAPAPAPIGHPGLVDRLLATALVQALAPDAQPHTSAVVLARIAGGRPEALVRARSQLLRNENGRPTRLTEAALDALGLAQAVGPVPDAGAPDGRGLSAAGDG